MHKEHEEDKTVIISETPVNVSKTTLVIDKTKHVSVIKRWNKKRLITVCFIVTILLICIGSYLIYRHKDQASLTNALKNFVQEHDLPKAEEVLSQIKLHRYNSKSITTIEKELIKMKEEHNMWEKAQNYYNLGMYKEAVCILQGFTSSTYYRDRAISELSAIKEKEIGQKINYAKQLYEQGDMDGSRLLIQQVLTMDPSNADANTLLASIELHVTENKKLTRVNHKYKTIENPGDLAYKNGDINAAIHLWAQTHKRDDTRKVVIATNIIRYMSAGEKALTSMDYNAAITSFNKVMSFISLLNIQNNSLENTVKRNLSISYSSLGMRALKDSLYVQANSYFQKSFYHDQANEEATKGFKILNQQAESLYKKAYIISGANHTEACSLYRQALDVAQKESGVYNKIKQRLSECE
jgi:tetratricopeptide (TPR) repeat protein